MPKYCKKKYEGMAADEQTAAIHSELLKTGLHDGMARRAQKVKEFILSGLPIRIDDVFEGFSTPQSIPETDKIEIIKLMLAHKTAQFNAWAARSTGSALESNISKSSESTARARHKEGKKGYLRVAGKTSVFDFVLHNAVATGEVNFLKFLVTELPEAFRPSPEAIGIAIESEVREMQTYPSEQSLRAIEYLTKETPANSKPEPFWLNRAKELCEQKISYSWFSEEEKNRLTRLTALLG